MRKKPTTREEKRKRLILDIIIKAFKILDALIQSMFLVYFFFLTDTNKRGPAYHKPMKFLVYWIILSVVVHLFFKYSKKLKIQRLIFLPIIIGYTVFLRDMAMHMPVWTIKYIGYKANSKLDMVDFIIMTVGLALCMWYFFMNMYELQALFKERKRSKY